MRLRTINDINLFLKEVDKCVGDVYLQAPDGSRYNLKSRLSQYVAIAQLIGENADDLELWCRNVVDEWAMIHFLEENPQLRH